MDKRAIGLVALALIGVALGPAVRDSVVLRAQQPAASAPLVFDGVTVIDVQNGQRLQAQRVVIVGNRIKLMGDVGKVTVPSGALVVDAKGKYLIPGLWDMHAHPTRATDVFYPLFIANGVTGFRDASSPVPLDTLRMWRREILAGTRVGPPRQILVGRAFEDTSAGCKQNEPQLACVADAATARHLVDSLKAAGADMIKLHDLKTELYFAAAAEARRVGIPFGGHFNESHDSKATAIDASDSGASIVDHLHQAGGMDTMCVAEAGAKIAGSVERCQRVAERFRHNGTWWVPTMVIGGQQPCEDSIIGPVPDLWKDSVLRPSWLHYSASAARTTRTPSSPTDYSTCQRLRIAHSVGLPIMAGTDEGQMLMNGFIPGAILHKELALYVVNGLTPLEALQTATLNPAKFLHATDSLGTVASGKLADLVLLDADPLTDIANTTAIRSVVANGRYFDRAALDSLVTAAVQAKARY